MLSEDWVLAGNGMPTSFGSPVSGELHEIIGPEDVLNAMDRVQGTESPKAVVLVHEAGGTTVGPLFGDIVGVMSTKGTLGAHLALLATEFGCPCVVGSELTIPVSDIKCVRLDPDGSIWATRAP